MTSTDDISKSDNPDTIKGKVGGEREKKTLTTGEEPFTNNIVQPSEESLVVENIIVQVIGKKTTVKGQAFKDNEGNYHRYRCIDDDIEYNLGDAVYIESQRADQPYFICTIQEFRRSKRDTLMVNIKWFYRPTEVPEPVYQLLVQDRHTEHSTGGNGFLLDPVIKGRELFISDAADTYPVSVLRGLCEVQHFQDIFSVKDFIPRQDTFFYILGYNPETRRLASTQGEIRVGPSHQARLPEYQPNVLPSAIPEKCEDREEIRWRPGMALDGDLLMYLRAARSMAAFAGMCDGGSADDGCLAASRDDTTINALDVLHFSGYDPGKALQALVKCPVPKGIDKKWSEEETKRFVKGLRQYGKNFFKIRKDLLPHKETGELIEFYYLWKKTPGAANTRPHRRHRRQSVLRRIRAVRNTRTQKEDLGDLSSASEEDNETDDSDSRDLSAYYCRHCFTTSSKDWHHAGKDKALLCTDCRLYFKKYGELPPFREPREIPNFMFRPVQEEDSRVRTRTRSKELNALTKKKSSRSNTPDSEDRKLGRRSPSSTSNCSAASDKDRKKKSDRDTPVWNRKRETSEDEERVSKRKKIETNESPSESVTSDSASLDEDGENEDQDNDVEGVSSRTSSPVNHLQPTPATTPTPVSLDEDTSMNAIPSENGEVEATDDSVDVGEIGSSVTAESETLNPVVDEMPKPSHEILQSDLNAERIKTEVISVIPPVTPAGSPSSPLPPNTDVTLPEAVDASDSEATTAATSELHVNVSSSNHSSASSNSTTQQQWSPHSQNTIKFCDTASVHIKQEVLSPRDPSEATVIRDTRAPAPNGVPQTFSMVGPPLIGTLPIVPTSSSPVVVSSYENIKQEATDYSLSKSPTVPDQRSTPPLRPSPPPITLAQSHSSGITTQPTTIITASNQGSIPHPSVQGPPSVHSTPSAQVPPPHPSILPYHGYPHYGYPYSYGLSPYPQRPTLPNAKSPTPASVTRTSPSLGQQPLLTSVPISHPQTVGGNRNSPLSDSMPPLMPNPNHSTPGPMPQLFKLSVSPAPSSQEVKVPLNSYPFPPSASPPKAHLPPNTGHPAMQPLPPSVAIPPTFSSEFSKSHGTDEYASSQMIDEPEEEIPSPTILVPRGPSPDPKIEDSECHRSQSAIFLRHWNRGDCNSCARTDLTFKPVPDSKLARQREERLRKQAEKEREEREKAAMQARKEMEKRETPKPGSSGPVESISSPAYDRITPRGAPGYPDTPALRQLSEYARPHTGFSPGLQRSLPSGLQLPSHGIDPVLQYQLSLYGDRARMEMEQQFEREKREREFRELRERELNDRLKAELEMKGASGATRSLDPHWLELHRRYSLPPGAGLPVPISSGGMPQLPNAMSPFGFYGAPNAQATLSQLERERLERLGLPVPPSLVPGPVPGPGPPPPSPSEVERYYVERVALGADPMLRLQMAGINPEIHSHAHAHTHAHAHAHTHLHLHTAQDGPPGLQIPVSMGAGYPRSAGLLSRETGMPQLHPSGLMGRTYDEQLAHQLSAQAAQAEQLQRQMLLERERFPHPGPPGPFNPQLVHEEFLRQRDREMKVRALEEAARGRQ